MIVVIFGLKFRFTASLFSTLGNNSLLIALFVVSSHWLCHFLVLSFRASFFIALFGMLSDDAVGSHRNMMEYS